MSSHLSQQQSQAPLKQTVVGVLAHVDAGKTTLTEALLYHSGAIRKQGRVDHKDSFLDFQDVERKRGITVFAKQVDFYVNRQKFTLIDTPGHVDLSLEMERALAVLDIAVLVISAMDGIQSHTATILHLLDKHQIPTLIFINKSDRPEVNREELIQSLKAFDERFIVWNTQSEDDMSPSATTIEELAFKDEALLDCLLVKSPQPQAWLPVAQALFWSHKIRPCVFGSALTGDHIDGFLQLLTHFAPKAQAPEHAVAKVYKITHDEHGQKLTLLKVLQPQLKTKSKVFYHSEKAVGHKINEMYYLHGNKLLTTTAATLGEIGAVTGLDDIKPGQQIYLTEADLEQSANDVYRYSKPVLETSLILPEGLDVTVAMRDLKQLAAEDPELEIHVSPKTGNIQMRVMGNIQMEVLVDQIKQRFHVDVAFGPCDIIYKETIQNAVTGYGHYEPLGHYAGVELDVEQGVDGQGIVVKSAVDHDLERRHESLIMSHIKDKDHLGVLTGSSLTDVTITLKKLEMNRQDTKQGDLRNATYRAIRQALMKADNVLLEPWYQFEIILPYEHVGRAMSDIQRMYGECGQPDVFNQDKLLLKGQVPIVNFLDYPIELSVYTSGEAIVYLQYFGYRPCYNRQQVIENMGYDPEADLENTPNSIFFGKGAGYEVKWHDVDRLRH